MSVAPIECLPVELLQPIFFVSGYNLGLLQASDRIAAKLSSDYVYSPTSTYWLDGIKDSRYMQSAAQTYIFASKWMTWSYFKSWTLRTYEQNGCLCGLTSEQGCFDPQWPPNFENATGMVFSRSHLPRMGFVKGRIPKKLLGGPWTPDKIQFLSFLLWFTSMTVDWADQESRQTAIKGRLQAIRERKLEAVELFNRNRRLGRAADMSLIRFAVIDADCDRSIVYDTMSTASTWGPDDSYECEELDRWCEDRTIAGDPKGRWLKAKLEELRTPIRPGKILQGDKTGYRRLIGGQLSSEAADYDGAFDDQLIVRQHKWTQQQVRQFGWWYNPQYSQKQGLHGVRREDLDDFWAYAHGTHHAIAGTLDSEVGPPHIFWVDAWIPVSTCHCESSCTCPVTDAEDE